jgi:hypothetical protein
MPEKKDVPSMFIEWSDRQDSGWVQGDVERTPSLRFNPNVPRRDCPSRATIPNTGHRRKRIVETVNGKEVVSYINERLRYIKNCPHITVEEQEKYGFTPNVDPSVDKIVITNAYAVVVRDGDVGLYDYLSEVSYRGNNINRCPNAVILYNSVDLLKETEKVNERVFETADAVSAVKALMTKTKSGYKYNEAKIDGLCSLFNVSSDTYEGKINILIKQAQSNPDEFLQLASKMDGEAMAKVLLAEKLKMIAFKPTGVEYVDNKKVLIAFDTRLTKSEMVDKVAAIFTTIGHEQVVKEFNAKLEAAKEKQYQTSSN